MSLRTFHYYHATSGAMHSKRFSCDAGNPYAEQDAAANAPESHKVLEAQLLEPWKHRVDVSTGLPQKIS